MLDLFKDLTCLEFVRLRTEEEKNQYDYKLKIIHEGLCGGWSYLGKSTKAISKKFDGFRTKNEYRTKTNFVQKTDLVQNMKLYVIRLFVFGTKSIFRTKYIELLNE